MNQGLWAGLETMIGAATKEANRLHADRAYIWRGRAGKRGGHTGTLGLFDYTFSRNGMDPRRWELFTVLDFAEMRSMAELRQAKVMR